MSDQIRKVGIVGAGTMGAGIAAHVANVGLPVVLLDIVTPGLSEGEQNKPAARNRVVQSLYKRMVKSKPAQLARADRGELITLGNVEDDFELLADCDWVVEVIIEQLEPKQALMARLEETCKPTAIITSNTSGIPINQIAVGRSDEFRARFMGTHFFNPPRYLKLLEVIPTEDTDEAAVARMSDFARHVLGKGVVLCKDRPNFIGNRFGAVTGAYIAERALSQGYTVAEVDALTGPLLGRPKTGYFRLADLVGLDVRTSVLKNLYPYIPHDPYREVLKGENSWAVYDRMLENGWLGNKRGQGFYKKVVHKGKRAFWALNTDTFEYEPVPPVSFESMSAAQKIRPLGERMQSLLNGTDRGATFVRDIIYFTLDYAAYVTPEMAYSLVDVDNAVRWGFNHQVGPFQLWDMLGVAETAAKMEQAGFQVATWVKEMLAAGHSSFYQDGSYYDFETNSYQPTPIDPKEITILGLREQNPVIESNQSATLHDMGDGVLLLEFHSKANAVDSHIQEMGRSALARLESDFDALVIGNNGKHFSVGANLGGGRNAAADDWAARSARIRKGQQLMMDLRHAPKPVVTAVHQRALGGGAEFTMHGWATVADHESYIGLVETGVGLIPAWGGCKETLRRKVNPVKQNPHADALPAVRDAFSQIMQAQISKNAWDAKTLGYLHPNDQIVMNSDHRLAVAKETALALARQGTRPPEIEKIYAAGNDALYTLYLSLKSYQWAQYMSEYDGHIGRKLAYVLCGGNLSRPQWVDPWHILDLEREAILSLMGEPKTHERIRHMLKTGKPLRN
ncbi:MAG: 3-hydroxyacyl-CoA dehydrogenase NAD-binding domain-containing protein [Ardenticatenaceae bacterium]